MTRRNSMPPVPWSPRMRAAAEVLQAYLDVETKLKHDLDTAHRLDQTASQKALLGKISAAKLQTDAARAQIWIIHQEEQNK